MNSAVLTASSSAISARKCLSHPRTRFYQLLVSITWLGVLAGILYVMLSLRRDVSVSWARVMYCLSTWVGVAVFGWFYLRFMQLAVVIAQDDGFQVRTLRRALFVPNGTLVKIKQKRRDRNRWRHIVVQYMNQNGSAAQFEFVAPPISFFDLLASDEPHPVVEEIRRRIPTVPATSNRIS